MYLCKFKQYVQKFLHLNIHGFWHLYGILRQNTCGYGRPIVLAEEWVCGEFLQVLMNSQTLGMLLFKVGNSELQEF